MALSAAVNYDVVGQTETIAITAAPSAQTIYKGAIVNITTTGFAKAATDTLGETPMGVAKETVVLAGLSAETVIIERGMLWIAKSGAAQTDVGELIYATADDTITTSVGTNTRTLGLCIGFKTGFVLVDTRTHSLIA
jgi:hypothetical protein